MTEIIEALKWVVLNYGAHILSLGASFGIFLWIAYRNAGTDTLKTVNSLVLLNSQQLVQLQADIRDLTAKYIELLKSSGEAVAREMLSANKLQNFMVLSESNKAEWILERDGLKQDIETANETLKEQSIQIAELRQQVQELLALVKVRDAEIKDLKEDSAISEQDKEFKS